ncbi:MAG: ABC transporter ATP-binding protein, partial [Acidimicrobiia bacterium]
MQMHQTMMGFRRDPDVVNGARVERALIRRVLRLTSPYRNALIGFLITVVLSAAVGVVPSLLFRSLLDDAVGSKDKALVLGLAIAAVGVALANATLSLLQRFYSARVGEGLIYDMRVALFDHVQRLPISFFTRVQTGALMSRMNGDVVGAQQAVTNTIGTVVQNVITLTITLGLMVALEWRLTLLTLVVLPAFIIPARRIGRKLQVITRDGFMVNASMSNTIAERFNVAGALVVKLFGRQDRERDEFATRAAQVRDIGIASAMYSRVLMVALGFVAAVGTAIVYFVGGRLVISGAISIGTLGAMTLLVSQ